MTMKMIFCHKEAGINFSKCFVYFIYMQFNIYFLLYNGLKIVEFEGWI